MTEPPKEPQKVEPSSATPAAIVESTSPPSSSQVVINLPDQNLGKKSDLPDVINAFAALLWPIVVLILVLSFKEQIVSLIRRLKSGKAFGAEAEFEKDLENLHIEANRVKEETHDIQSSAENNNENTNKSNIYSINDLILNETKRSPRIGLMLLSSEIDKLARRIAASSGHQKKPTLRDQIELWKPQLPYNMLTAFQLFSQVRNRIVHGIEATEQEILSAIDSGLILYDALSAIPIESNVVTHPGVDIFGDPEATRILDGKGIIMETTHDGLKTSRIFPSTLTHFTVGMRLTWEWGMDRVWGPAWYRDPDNGEIKQAWGSSAEFIGKDLDQV